MKKTIILIWTRHLQAIIKSQFFGYLFSIVLIALVTFICSQIQLRAGVSVPFLLGFIAVIFSAMYYGYGPGLFTAFLMALITDIYFFTPANGYNGGAADWIRSALFIFDAFLLCSITRSLRFSEERYRAFLSQTSEGIWRIELARPVPVHLPVEEQIDLFYQYAYLAECNEAMAKLYGFDTAENLVGLPLEKLFSRDNLLVHNYLKRFINGDYKLTDAESQEKDKDGNPIYILNNLIGTVIDKHLVRCWGTQRNITLQKSTEEVFHKSREQLEIILGGVADGITALEPGKGLIYANEAAAKISGFNTAEEMIGLSPDQILEKYEILDIDGKKAGVADLPSRNAQSKVESQEAIIHYRIKDSSEERWSRVKTSPIFDMQDPTKSSMIINIYSDITKQRQDELDKQAEETINNILGKAGEILNSSLDYQKTLANVAATLVPQFADWCAVDLVEDGSIHRLALAHKDPNKIKWAEELSKKYPVDPNALTGVPAVIRSGKPEFVPILTDEMLVAAKVPEDIRKLLEQIGYSSSICVALKTPNKTIGAITVIAAESGKHYTQKDLQLIQEIADRAALAVENAMLYREAQQAAEREHEKSVLLDTLISRAPIGFAFLDRNLRYAQVNDTLADIHGISAEAHLGKTMTELFPNFGFEAARKARESLETGKAILNHEVSEEQPPGSGNVRHWLKSYYPIHSINKEIIGLGLIVNEITERKKAEETIRYQAFHDALTGLPNRKLFTDRLLQAINYAARHSQQLAIMFLDLDRFKNINDTLGHSVGDDVLRETAKRLRRNVRDEDTVSRLGGDEFVILLFDIQSDRDVVRIARKILKSFGPAFNIESQRLHISTSIGIAMYPNDGDTVISLLKNADTALYRAKEAGRNNYQLYNKTMSVVTSEKLRLENELRHALDHAELIAHYQPVVDAETGKVIELEALMRWTHPELGIVYPNEFIPLAEETGLIVQMTSALFRTVGAQLKSWKNMHMDGFKIGINLSGRQFIQPNLVDRLTALLRENNLTPEVIELEITESIAMQDIETTITKLNQLRDAGFSISIDDFGTGYSSLNYLKRFPINTLKIDKSFIKNCLTDAQDGAIIQAIITMAHSLGLKVIAEGVESEEQMKFLKSLGCDNIQGYYVSYPLPASDITRLLRKDKR